VSYVGRPNRRLQLLAVVGLLGLVVAVCLLVPGPGGEGAKKSQADTPSPEASKARTQTFPSGPHLPVELKDGIGREGKPEAKVKVEVYLPGHGGCGDDTASFVHRVYQANKDRIHVVFIDFETAAGSEYQTKAGLHCSGVAVNGKQSFKVPGDAGRTRTVNLASNMGDQWGEKEFLKALDVAFKKAYGKPANHQLPPAAKPGGPGGGGTHAAPMATSLKAPEAK
jgi:hypothetical protein